MRLLDLFCCQGGAGMGYHRAGFEVVGVDIEPQPRFPFRFVQADALEYLAAHWQEYDAFHASPPCQGYSAMKELPWLRDKEYPLLILPTREMLRSIHAASGKPWVIENVEGARWGSGYLRKRGLESHGMQAGFLCQRAFGLDGVRRRHRLFETSFLWLAPEHTPHSRRTAAGVETASVRTRTELHSLAAWQQGNATQKAGVAMGHAKGWREASVAMGVEWMDRDGTSQAIPPVMTEYIGRQMLANIRAYAAAKEEGTRDQA